MAGRKEKYTIDYFPHYVNHKKTMHIIEQKFGNDGYAFWFKLLELLGKSEHHIFDINTEENKLYFFSQVNVTEELGIQILDLLYRLEAIDRELYDKGFVFSQKFCDNVADAYRKRKSEVATKAEIVSIYSINSDINTNNSAINTQSKVEYSKVEEIKVNIAFENWWNLYDKKRNKKYCQNYWERKMNDDERLEAYHHTTDYVKHTEKVYRKDPERYLRNKAYQDEIIIKSGNQSKLKTSDILKERYRLALLEDQENEEK